MNRRVLVPFLILLVCATPVWADTQVQSQEPTPGPNKTFSQKINDAFTPLVEVLTNVLFWDPFAAVGVYDQQVYHKDGTPALDERGNPVRAPLRLIVIWLFAGGLFFTFYLRLIGFRGLRHAMDILRGKYVKPGAEGEVTPFQSVTTALSATVGMGNIAGVAMAIGIGGPGATFWMIMAGLLGMAMKFAECTLAVKYRKVNKDGSISGGPMY